MRCPEERRGADDADQKSVETAGELIQPLFVAPPDANRTGRERAGQHWTVWTHYSAFCARPDVAIAPWPISPFAVALFLHDKTQTGRGDSKGTLLVYRNALTNVQKAAAPAFAVKQPPSMLRKSEIVTAAIDSGRKPATGARGKRARKADADEDGEDAAPVVVDATLDPLIAGGSTAPVAGPSTAPPPKKRNRNNPAGSSYGTGQTLKSRPKNPLNMPIGPQSTDLDRLRGSIRTVPDLVAQKEAVLTALKAEPEDGASGASSSMLIAQPTRRTSRRRSRSSFTTRTRPTPTRRSGRRTHATTGSARTRASAPSPSSRSACRSSFSTSARSTTRRARPRSSATARTSTACASRLSSTGRPSVTGSRRSARPSSPPSSRPARR